MQNSFLLKTIAIVIFTISFNQFSFGIMTEDVSFPASACESVTYQDQNDQGSGNIYPTNGYYVLENYKDWDNGGSGQLRNYTCHSKKDTPAFNIHAVWGVWQGVYDQYYQGGVWFSVDGKSAPCSVWQPAYNGAQFTYFAGDYTTCLNHNNAKDYGADGSTYWSQPFITIPQNWSTIFYKENEWDYPGGTAGDGSRNIQMTIKHDIIEPPPPTPSNQFELKAYLTGAWFDSTGKYEYAGEDTQLTRDWDVTDFFRVPVPDAKSTCLPYQYIGMSIADSVISNMESNTNYSCSAHITSNFGFDSGEIPITKNGELQAGTPISQLVDEPNYLNKGWYKEYNPTTDSAFPLKICNMVGQKQTLVLNMTCTSNKSGDSPVSYPEQRINSYLVQHF